MFTNNIQNVNSGLRNNSTFPSAIQVLALDLRTHEKRKFEEVQNDCKHQVSEEENVKEKLVNNIGNTIKVNNHDKNSTKKRSYETKKQVFEESHAIDLECNICGKMSKSKSRMKKHMKKHDKSVKVDKYPFKCFQCKLKFDQLAKMLLHRNYHITKKSNLRKTMVMTPTFLPSTAVPNSVVDYKMIKHWVESKLSCQESGTELAELVMNMLKVSLDSRKMVVYLATYLGQDGAETFIRNLWTFMEAKKKQAVGNAS